MRATVCPGPSSRNRVQVQVQKKREEARMGQVRKAPSNMPVGRRQNQQTRQRQQGGGSGTTRSRKRSYMVAHGQTIQSATDPRSHAGHEQSQSETIRRHSSHRPKRQTQLNRHEGDQSHQQHGTNARGNGRRKTEDRQLRQILEDMPRRGPRR